jgi:hypothetical protein
MLRPLRPVVRQVEDDAITSYDHPDLVASHRRHAEMITSFDPATRLATRLQHWGDRPIISGPEIDERVFHLIGQTSI